MACRCQVNVIQFFDYISEKVNLKLVLIIFQLIFNEHQVAIKRNINKLFIKIILSQNLYSKISHLKYMKVKKYHNDNDLRFQSKKNF